MKANFLRSTQLLIVLTASLFLSACQSTSLIETYQENHDGTSQKNNAGFLSDYSKLKQVEGVDGQQVLRWVNPEFKKQKYKKLNIAPLVVSPVKGQRVEISGENRQQIQHYFDQQLKKSLKDQYEISDDSGNGILQIKMAITGIELNAEGMKITEVLPYGAVIGLVRTATDTRNQEVTVILEVEISNSQTKEVEISLVRIGLGENIRMLWDANFSLQHVKSLLDEWALLAATSFQKLLN